MPHHHIVFGDAWEQTFRDIIDDGVVMRDPSLLVTRPTAGDPALAPTGRDLLYVLAPAPNLSRGNVDWEDIGGSYTDSMIAAVTDRLPQLGADAELLHVVNPADWARQGMAAGTPFALAHTFAQTGPFRPANTVRGIDNVVLAGSSTVPGVGVPTALLSGRLAADRITGAVTRRVATHIGSGQIMIRSELDAAGVKDPALRSAYQRCRVLNAEHGRTFFLATRLLAPEQRPAVHALYGFARRADDILDDFDPTCSTAERAERLQLLATQLFNQLVQQEDCGDDPTLRAVVHTARRYGIPWEMFDDFLTSMRMDLTVTDYPDRTALERYMHGSAEVIGLQMLPVLGTVGPREDAAPYAAALGKAFQLTNFLRDVDEDLQRGRVYLPADELAAYRVDRDMLTWCHTNKRTDARVRRALTEQHAATRRVYEFARKGIELLDPRSRPCVAAAYTLYSEILDRIESIDFAIFNQRATVGTGRRLQVAGLGLMRAWRARLTHGTKS